MNIAIAIIYEANSIMRTWTWRIGTWRIGIDERWLVWIWTLTLMDVQIKHQHHCIVALFSGRHTGVSFLQVGPHWQGFRRLDQDWRPVTSWTYGHCLQALALIFGHCCPWEVCASFYHCQDLVPSGASPWPLGHDNAQASLDLAMKWQL